MGDLRLVVLVYMPCSWRIRDIFVLMLVLLGVSFTNVQGHNQLEFILCSKMVEDFDFKSFFDFTH